MLPKEKAECNREIRAHLGKRLRTHYEHAEHISVIDGRLAELVKQLSKTAEEQDWSKWSASGT